jgi:hypothetical protein
MQNPSSESEMFLEGGRKIWNETKLPGLTISPRMSGKHKFRLRPAKLHKKIVISLQDAALCEVGFGVGPAIFSQPLAESGSGAQRAHRFDQRARILGGRYDSTVRPADLASRFAAFAYGSHYGPAGGHVGEEF